MGCKIDSRRRVYSNQKVGNWKWLRENRIIRIRSQFWNGIKVVKKEKELFLLAESVGKYKEVLQNQLEGFWHCLTSGYITGIPWQVIRSLISQRASDREIHLSVSEKLTTNHLWCFYLHLLLVVVRESFFLVPNDRWHIQWKHPQWWWRWQKWLLKVINNNAAWWDTWQWSRMGSAHTMHCVPFAKLALTAPPFLAQLDVKHFEGLGAKKAEDGHKLFYLVQRIKCPMNTRWKFSFKLQ